MSDLFNTCKSMVCKLNKFIQSLKEGYKKINYLNVYIFIAKSTDDIYVRKCNVTKSS